MTSDVPSNEGLTHTIIHPGGCNDVPWIKVRSQRNADGTQSHVWERWVAFSGDPLYLALFARWDPGMIVRRHGHHSPHTLTVLAGEFACGDESCGVGTHIELPFGAAFGPFVAGSDGVEQLPDPPIELPAGLEDLRAVFGAGGRDAAS